MIEMLEISTYRNEDGVAYFFTSETFPVTRSLEEACGVLTTKGRLKSSRNVLPFSTKRWDPPRDFLLYNQVASGCLALSD